MEVFQNGRFSTGEPVYQIGTKNDDGTYKVVVYALMSKAEAEAKLAEIQPVKAPIALKVINKPTKKTGK